MITAVRAKGGAINQAVEHVNVKLDTEWQRIVTPVLPVASFT